MKQFYLVLVFILLFKMTFSQINEFGYPLYKYFDAKEYNGHVQNWDIVQDSSGLIYMANIDGVLQYDGVEWRKINIDKNPEIRSLAIDKRGIIYVGCSNQFGLIRPNDSGQLKYRSLLPKLDTAYVSFSRVYNVNVIADTVYFSSDKYTLFKYLINQDSIFVIKLPKYSLFTFKVGDEIYGGSFVDGLFKIKNDSTVKLIDGDFYSRKAIYSVINDSGNLIIITGNSGIFSYNKLSGKSTELFTSETRNILKNSTLYSSCRLQNDIVLDALGSGIITVDKQTGQIRSILDSEVGIQDHLCTSVKKFSNSRSLWASLNIGLSRIEYDSPIRYFGKESKLEGSVNDIVRFRDKIYVATDLGVFYLRFGQDNKPEFTKIEGIDEQIFSLTIVHDNKGNDERLIIGSINGIYQFTTISEPISLIEENLNGIDKLFDIKVNKSKNDFRIYVLKLLYSSSDQILWVGSSSRIIGLRNIGNQWVVTPAVFDLGDAVGSIIESVDHKIWVSTKQNGVYCISGKDTEYTIKKYTEENGLPVNYALVLNNILDEITCSSTYGIYVYDPESDSFIRDARFQEKYTNGSLEIVKVYNFENYVFVNSNDKDANLAQLVRDGNQFVDGSKLLRRIGTLRTDCMYGDSNYLWIASSNGLYTYNLNSQFKEINQFPCLIRKVEGRDSVYFNGTFFQKVSTGNIPVSFQPDYQKPVIPYWRNDITFHFASPYYEGSEAIVYSYYLDGFKSNWSKWNSESKAVFTNLDEGEYAFKVKAKNCYGDESEIGTYSFTILPPWYRTIIAYFGYFIIALLSIYIIVKLYTRKLKQEKIRLEGIVRERTAEIREQRDEIAEQKQSIEDSILYARRIQRAILPSNELAEEILPEYFILFRPRDIVSGDYFWMNKIGNRVIVAAADCTGHGVPGAFMSMLGVSFLNEIVLKENTTEPHLILNKLRERVKKTLKQEGKEGEAKDGMDIAVVTIDENQHKLYFAGAYNPAYIYRGTELIELKADRMPIGIYIKEKESFTLNEYNYQKGDSFYIASDGYVDQFGGPKKDKFKSKSFKELLASIQDKSMNEQHEILNQTIEDWIGEDEQIDDMVVIGVRL